MSLYLITLFARSILFFSLFCLCALGVKVALSVDAVSTLIVILSGLFVRLFRRTLVVLTALPNSVDAV